MDGMRYVSGALVLLCSVLCRLYRSPRAFSNARMSFDLSVAKRAAAFISSQLTRSITMNPCRSGIAREVKK